MLRISTWIHLAAAALVVFATSACSQRHVQLKFPDTTPGEEFTCTPTDGQTIKCEGAKTINAAENNQSNTLFFFLPKECKGHFYEITIHDSGSAHPSLDVKCAPLENKFK